MRAFSLVAIALLLVTQVAISQPVSTEEGQETIGLRFLDAVINERDQEAWAMMDAELQGLADYKFFHQIFQTIRKMRSVGGFTPEFARYLIRSEPTPSGKNMLRQVFVFAGDTSSSPRFTISLAFLGREAKQIIGIRLNDVLPRMPPYRPGVRSVTQADDREIDGQQGWLIGRDSVAIDGVSIILLPEDKVMLVVKVYQEITDEPGFAEFAEARAVPIVRHALKQGYMQRASDILLAYPDRTLVENIGVLFLSPSSMRGYRALITPDQYNEK